MPKKSAPPPDSENATTIVNIADFQRTRDSVIVALATLQSSVQDLSRAYINHANTVLAPGRGGALDSNLTNILSESGLLTGAQAAGAAPVLALGGEEVTEGKKKRKRVPHDPHAPKRALTPYFLYMQSARAQIARELGDQAKPKEVADEGTRRWTEMPANEKAIWDAQYQKNLAAYRVKMAAYKAGHPVPSDDDATKLVEAGKVPDSVPGPVKEPEPPKGKRRKTADATPAKETPRAAKSPEKEKKSKKSKAEAPTPAPPAAPAPSSKGEKKKKSKKAA
ncbi:hypothetical protein DV736_g5422, partial [Chaetothyriales sp. CBS 134916]